MLKKFASPNFLGELVGEEEKINQPSKVPSPA